VGEVHQDIVFGDESPYSITSELFAEKAKTFTQRRRDAEFPQRKALFFQGQYDFVNAIHAFLCVFFATLRLCVRFCFRLWRVHVGVKAGALATDYTDLTD
jgi:hypothetical protein